MAECPSIEQERLMSVIPRKTEDIWLFQRHKERGNCG